MTEQLPLLASLRSRTDGQEQAPAVPYYHMWTGPDGKSQLNTALMQAFGRKSVGGGAAPQWMRPFPGKVTAVSFAILPVGWKGEWHESPSPQWVIPLSGRWFIETQDGHHCEMGPGDLHFGQDQGTQDHHGRKGHLSGTIGDEPCVQLMIQFATSPAAACESPFA
ncbi:cupin domain-containing protein [Gluconobacter morbifer]|uniref:Cupin 2 conserved barrel domain-containing protein n=1 Tax=Gluconobacter morbifer G707 TaxID=1088869 RepID=G6XJ52_9PROT|nr:hypothetical protein [Gluconobacter morbifer]EHH68168.1 hypothetical protein GMO_15180 [Gluconobacter morbifer G707]